MSAKRIKMTVTMDVTIPQALALQAMFEYWNQLSRAGCTRHVGFFVDGDGDFHPNCDIKFSDPIPKLTNELRGLAIKMKWESGRLYDFDNIAWKLSDD
jgi:hypothetical protein